MPVPVVNDVARTKVGAGVRCLPGVADEGRDRLRGGRLNWPRTADDLNDLIAQATQRRWSPTVLLERVVAAELEPDMKH